MSRTTGDGESTGPGFGRWPAWLGPWLGKLRLHAIEPREAPGRPPTIAKRRRWFGPLLIGPGNLYLHLLGTWGCGPARRGVADPGACATRSTGS